MVIEADDTVTWTRVGGLPHNVVECGADWSKGLACTGADWSSAIQTSGSFNRQFDMSGVTYYRCTVQPTTMRGTVTVASAVGGIAELPSATAFTIESPDSPSSGPQLFIALAAGGAAEPATGGGALVHAPQASVASRPYLRAVVLS